MRVIAGLAKGRRLVAPEGLDTRPMTDRVREALFSSLGERVRGARVLDLYAGAGSIGIEALSRGAASAVFVESGRAALEALRANLAAVDLGGTVVGITVERFLERPAGVFDLVFIDPPWPLPTPEVEEVLARLVGLLSDDAEVVVSRRAQDAVPQPPSGLRYARDRRYGDGRICWYTRSPEETPDDGEEKDDE